MSAFRNFDWLRVSIIISGVAVACIAYVAPYVPVGAQYGPPTMSDLPMPPQLPPPPTPRFEFPTFDGSIPGSLSSGQFGPLLPTDITPLSMPEFGYGPLNPYDAGTSPFSPFGSQSVFDRMATSSSSYDYFPQAPIGTSGDAWYNGINWANQQQAWGNIAGGLAQATVSCGFAGTGIGFAGGPLGEALAIAGCLNGIAGTLQGVSQLCGSETLSDTFGTIGNYSSLGYVAGKVIAYDFGSDTYTRESVGNLTKFGGDVASIADQTSTSMMVISAVGVMANYAAGSYDVASAPSASSSASGGFSVESTGPARSSTSWSSETEGSYDYSGWYD